MRSRTPSAKTSKSSRTAAEPARTSAGAGSWTSCSGRSNGVATRCRMSDTLERLERWLRTNQPALLDAMRPGVTDDELGDLERALGRELPEDVRTFYRW